MNVGGRLEFVGIPNATDATRFETWSFTGSKWIRQDTSGSPPVRIAPAVGALHGTIVLFGGQTLGGVTFLSDTWTLDGEHWMKRSPATHPPARTRAAVASLGDRLLLFGGASGTGSLGDTWLWDGSTWTLQTGTHAPSPRSGAVAAAVGSRILLFGGCAGGGYLGCSDVGTVTAQTWQWDPTTSWTLLHPATSPRARTLAVASSLRARVILFGGFGGPHASEALSDTWTWDGTAWTRQVGAAAPPAGWQAMACR